MDIFAEFGSRYAMKVEETTLSRATGVRVVCGGAIERATNFYCRGRVRDDYLLLATLEGRAWVMENGRRQFLEPGDWFLLRPGRHHAYRDRSPWSMAYLHFGGAAVDIAARETGALSMETLRFRQRSAEALELLRRILRERANAPAADARRIALTLQLLATLRADYRVDSGVEGALRQVETFIETRFAARVTMKELSEMAGLSIWRFSREFKRRFGVSPSRALEDRRLEAARDLLLRENASPAGKIARQVGFDDPLYFSRRFKKREGLSPTEYRRQILAQNP